MKHAYHGSVAMYICVYSLSFSSYNSWSFHLSCATTGSPSLLALFIRREYFTPAFVYINLAGTYTQRERRNARLDIFYETEEGRNKSQKEKKRPFGNMKKQELSLLLLKCIIYSLTFSRPHQTIHNTQVYILSRESGLLSFLLLLYRRRGNRMLNSPILYHLLRTFLYTELEMAFHLMGLESFFWSQRAVAKIERMIAQSIDKSISRHTHTHTHTHSATAFSIC